ncbi:hypothetical protein JDN40_07265 [Rhodomicrobium vannielii ATCC 17100]|uniref:hypothetical protein n=1 Tax=Rhodomicrobium vannielii TaxID=1069 RepID=UPI001919D4C9|nr:hypothetical protein [Rhodomicrobium vannielii]MBJ7533898.1 hypothetical protein [Rhodomicrobium vannielii ATCC 17100]
MTILTMAPLSEADYCAIESALLASDKGRRFLRAYVDRNRGLETLRLLRSISRLHRAALGVPGLNAEVCRDLSGILSTVSKHRHKAFDCFDEGDKAELLLNGMEEIEAAVIALIESIEDRMADSLNEEIESQAQQPGSPAAPYASDRTAKLFGELSSYFTTETR